MIGQYMWIGSDGVGDGSNIVIGVTSREGPEDEMYHIDLYKLLEVSPGSYDLYEFAMDTIHLSATNEFRQNLVETVTYSAGSFFWLDVYTGTRMAEQMRICSSR